MEKNRPHNKLAVIKQLVQSGQVRTTGVARDGALALNLDVPGMLQVILALQPGDFYKSMTSYQNSKEWQDVYEPSTPHGNIYLKLIVSNGLLVISFKESTE